MTKNLKNGKILGNLQLSIKNSHATGQRLNFLSCLVSISISDRDACTDQTFSQTNDDDLGVKCVTLQSAVCLLQAELV